MNEFSPKFSNARLGFMRYLSTRAREATGLEFCEILLAGLAPDGGLYLPESYPQVDEQLLNSWRNLLAESGYAALAREILGLYIGDIPTEDLDRLCHNAYNAKNFGSEAVVPVDKLTENEYLAHLSNGPTAAFKDLAMQMLGQLFEYELGRRESHLNILGATSGDTGSAAEYAMLGKENITVTMLTPLGRMTPFQQAQMFSIDDPAIINVAVQGVFDDCQDLVKEISSDLNFKKKWHIGAVNSINWARLLAQVVYYFAAYFRATKDNKEKISFAVPTGNFGNICAGHIAKEMGLPIDKLILATNENDVLAEFFHTGVYRPRESEQVYATSSPSMDISKASNFERFIADIYGRNGESVAELFEKIAKQGYFDISNSPAFNRIVSDYGFISGCSTHEDRVATIAEIYEETGVIIDPHTADAVRVSRDLRYEGLVTGDVVILETALPIKFAETIEEALGMVPRIPEAFAGIEDLPRHVTTLPADVNALKTLLEENLG